MKNILEIMVDIAVSHMNGLKSPLKNPYTNLDFKMYNIPDCKVMTYLVKTDRSPIVFEIRFDLRSKIFNVISYERTRGYIRRLEDIN